MRSLNLSLPRQKLPRSAKGKTWLKKNIDALDASGYYQDSQVRLSVYEKQINMDLYNGIIHMSDIQTCLNPTGLEGAENFLPKKVNNYSLISPRIDLLVGEESKRRFEWKVLVANDSAISSKEARKKKEFESRMMALLEDDTLTDEQYIRQMDRIKEWATYEYQDIREMTATRILKHYWMEHKFDRMFLEGFREALVVGEEAYQIYIDSNEPMIKKLNPNQVHAFRLGLSNNLSDADMIVIDEYWSPGAIIDRWHDDLSSKEIDKIEKQSFSTGNTRDDVFTNNQEPIPHFGDIMEVGSSFVEDSIRATHASMGMGMPMDQDGNIRVLTVKWASYKMVQKVFTFDPVTGEPLVEIHSEDYIVDETKGESAEKLWIKEWYEGHKIGGGADGIYIGMGPCKHQFRKMSNPSWCHPGIVGKVYNFNQQKAYPLVSRLKPLQYLYNVIYDRLNEMLAKNPGKLLELDIASMPKGWQITDWLEWMRKSGIAVKDSFKVVNEGANVGALVGNLGHSGHSVIDVENGRFIQEHLMLLESIRRQIGEISGISEQRLGNISNRETVGGVERSVMQSSHNTEYWFYTHNECKLEVLNVFLDAAKVALSKNKIKRQFILDDSTTEIFDTDDILFGEADFGIFATTHPKAQEIDQMLKQNAMMALQSNMLTFSEVMDMYMGNSISEMRRKIENAENRRMEQQQQNAEAEREMMAAEQQRRMESEQAERDLKMDIEMVNIEKDLEIARIQAGVRSDVTAKEIEERIKDKDRSWDKEKTSKTLQTQENIAKISAANRAKQRT
jgi:hypothetical protein